jgi:leader peptidase (prepilin peptidase) / N-methyltransferase
VNNPVIEVILHLSVAVAGLSLSIIDAREYRLPNLGTGSLALAVGILGVLGASDAALGQAMACAVLSSGAFALLAWLPPWALGWGDVKLQVGLGFYLGLFSPVLVCVQVVGSFVIGGLVALWAVMARVRTPQDSVAFGPWMVLATLLTVVLGKSSEII